jgi:hypothetical protein
VKASYFPNWRASGAEGPWRVAPNLMVVVPTANNVELTYGRTGPEYAGVGLSVFGLLGLVLLARRTRPFPDDDIEPAERVMPHRQSVDSAAAYSMSAGDTAGWGSDDLSGWAVEPDGDVAAATTPSPVTLGVERTGLTPDSGTNGDIPSLFVEWSDSADRSDLDDPGPGRFRR